MAAPTGDQPIPTTRITIIMITLRTVPSAVLKHLAITTMGTTSITRGETLPNHRHSH